jgi:hypothetical protein
MVDTKVFSGKACLDSRVLALTHLVCSASNEALRLENGQHCSVQERLTVGRALDGGRRYRGGRGVLASRFN